MRRASSPLVSALGLALALCAAAYAPAGAAIEGPDGITVVKDSKLALTDIRWLEKAAQAGAAEVEAGKLAATQGKSAAVRNFGTTMVDHHTKANRELEIIAEAKGALLPVKPDNAHQSELKKLAGLKGDDFDKEYLAYAGAKDHEDAAKLFQDGIDHLTDLDLKSYAQKTLPVIKQHFEAVRDMRQGL